MNWRERQTSREKERTCISSADDKVIFTDKTSDVFAKNEVHERFRDSDRWTKRLPSSKKNLSWLLLSVARCIRSAKRPSMLQDWICRNANDGQFGMPVFMIQFVLSTYTVSRHCVHYTIPRYQRKQNHISKCSVPSVPSRQVNTKVPSNLLTCHLFLSCQSREKD